MNRQQHSNRSGLLLMEIIIAILFFSMIGAACLQLFAKSHTMSRDSEDLSHAVNQVSSAAELIRGNTDIASTLHTYYPAAERSGDAFSVYYNSSYEACKKASASYHMELSPTFTSDGDEVWHIAFFKNKVDKEVYQLDVISYCPVIP